MGRPVRHAQYPPGRRAAAPPAGAHREHKAAPERADVHRRHESALKDTGLLSWQKLAAAAALVAAACFAVDRVLFHGALSPEKWDDMSYEECLHRAAGRTVLLYVIVVAAPIAALLYSFLSLLRT